MLLTLITSTSFDLDVNFKDNFTHTPLNKNNHKIFIHILCLLRNIIYHHEIVVHKFNM